MSTTEQPYEFEPAGATVGPFFKDTCPFCHKEFVTDLVGLCCLSCSGEQFLNGSDSSLTKARFDYFTKHVKSDSHDP